MKKFTIILTGALLCAASSAMANAVITEKPEGTERWMHGYSTSYGVSSWGFTEKSTNDGVARHFVYAPDGTTVYLENPISGSVTDSWIKGTLANGKLTVETPQTIKITTNKNGEQEAWDLRRLIQHTYTDDNGKEVTEWVVDKEKSSVAFTVTDDAIKMDETGVMLGVCIGDEFYFYGDSDIVMTYVDEKAAVIPENAKVEKWTLTSGPETIRLATVIDVAEVGNEFIMRGIWADQPAATIKGIIKGDKLHIPSGQYVGFLTKKKTSYYTFMMNTVSTKVSFVDYYSSVADDLVFTIDRENNCLIPENDKHNIMIKTGRTIGYDVYQYEALHQAPAFRKNTEYGRPQAPTFVDGGFYSTFPAAEVPFVRILFSIKPFDEFGNGYAAADVRYSVWVDDEKFVFDADDAPNYKNLPEPTDELTLDFVNGWGMTHSKYSPFHERNIQVAQMGFEKVGIQVIHIHPETGKKTYSPVTYYYPDTKQITNEEVLVGVETVVSEGEVVAEMYHDLLGNRVDESFKGLCVKTTVYDNGNVKNVKMLKR